MSIEQTLPSNWYLRDDIFSLEREHIFFRDWVCVAREEQLPGPGDHLVLDVYGQSILLLRNTEGKLRGFYNVCRHRGAQLCASESGEDFLEDSHGVWWVVAAYSAPTMPGVTTWTGNCSVLHI